MAFRNEGIEPEMTVKSILETCEKPGIEILVINDASDEEKDFSPYPQVRYICNKRRFKFYLGRIFIVMFFLVGFPLFSPAKKIN